MEIILTAIVVIVLCAITMWQVLIHQKQEQQRQQDRREIFEVLQEHGMMVGGFKDHLTAMRVDIETMEKAQAEFCKNMDADVLQKMQDRIAVCEMAVGIRRLDKANRS